MCLEHVPYYLIFSLANVQPTLFFAFFDSSRSSNEA